MILSGKKVSLVVQSSSPVQWIETPVFFALLKETGHEISRDVIDKYNMETIEANDTKVD